MTFSPILRLRYTTDYDIILSNILVWIATELFQTKLSYMWLDTWIEDLYFEFHKKISIRNQTAYPDGAEVTVGIIGEADANGCIVNAVNTRNLWRRHEFLVDFSARTDSVVWRHLSGNNVPERRNSLFSDSRPQQLVAYLQQCHLECARCVQVKNDM